MILDTDSGGADIRDRFFDACVVGSGPAGLTVARKLAEAGYSVALMEGGGLEIDARSQDLYVGDIIGRDYWPLDSPRLRYFGGTSMHWGGRSRPLEAHDFAALPYHRLSGWPLAKSDLDVFAAETDAILDIPSAQKMPDPSDKLMEGTFQAIRYRRSPPTRFGEKYRAEVEASQQITLVLNASLVDLELSPDLRSVEAAIFRSYAPGDPGFNVRARCFVLCLGGLENPRLLLNATRQVPVGIGNENDLVGRYFSEHITYSVASVLFEGTPPPSRVYQPTLEMMQQNQVLDFELLLSTPARSFSNALARSTICYNDFVRDLAFQVLGRSIDCNVGGLSEYFESRAEARDTGSLGLIAEQALNPDSRVLLSEERDPFGLRRIALDWQYSDLDLHTLQTAVLVMGEKLASAGAGRLQPRDWLLADPIDPPQFGAEGAGEVAICHHMCTTRMSADPREGVVDANCRVHSVSNLYLGGSSVFATGGHANPTYTIVQLALRLGDHLAGILKA